MGTMDLPTTLRVKPLRALPEADVRALLRDDIRRMEETFDAEVQRMTASGGRLTFPRFPGPFAPASEADEMYQGFMYYPLLPIPIKTRSRMLKFIQSSVNNGSNALQDRLNELGLRSMPTALKLCHEQANSVLGRIAENLRKHNTKWTPGIADAPGHYWACIRSEQSNCYFHLDAWVNEKWAATTFDHVSLPVTCEWRAVST